MSEVKNIPRLRFPEFDGSWENNKLNSVFKFKQGVQCSIENQFSDFNDGMCRFIRIIDLTRKGEPARYINDPGFEHHITKEDLFMVRYGSPGLVGIGYEGIIANNLFRLIPKKKIVPGYFQFLLSKMERKILSLSGSSTMPAISFSDLNNLKVSIPSLPEQQKIADFLTAVDKRIELLEKNKTLLETYKKGVMKKIFNQEIRFKDYNGNDFPDWEEKRLGDLFNFIRGSTLSKSDLNKDGEFKCIHYGELFTIYNEVIRTIFSNTNKEGTRSIRGDILMPTSDVTPFGLATASCIQEKDVILGGDMNILRSKSNIEPVFFSYLLNFNVGSIIKLVTGTTIKHIYSKDLKPLRFNVPTDKTEQIRISEFFCSIDIQIELFQTQIDKSKTWKKGLLQNMLV